jgi:hypothetical protein
MVGCFLLALLEKNFAHRCHLGPSDLQATSLIFISHLDIPHGYSQGRLLRKMACEC